MSGHTSLASTIRDARLLVAALGAVLAVDWVLRHHQLARPIQGVIDETAHLATALLLVAAAPGTPGGDALLGVALGATLIDADHVPLECGYDGLTRGLSRPAPHSLVSVGLLLLGAATLPGRGRALLGGAAAGLATHLLRDLACGGAPLFWPLSAHRITLPYRVYAGLLLGAIAVASAQSRGGPNDGQK